jgi:hypothetical protein
MAYKRKNYKKYLQARRVYDRAHKAEKRDYYKANKSKLVGQMRARLWKGITRKEGSQFTHEDFESINEAQNGKCRMCGELNGNRSLCVDHDHKTGLFRGLLCTPCNQGLGCFKDNPDLLERAKRYLQETNHYGSEY